MARFADVEVLAVAYIPAATGDRAATLVPSNLAEVLRDLGTGFHRVLRGPGSSDEITDSPLLDVDSFTLRNGSPVDRWERAEAVRQAMFALAGRQVNGVLVDRVANISGPTFVDYDNPDLDRLVHSYRLDLRKI